MEKNTQSTYWFRFNEINSFSLEEKRKMYLLLELGYYIKKSVSKDYAEELIAHLYGNNIETLGELIDLEEEHLREILETSNEKVVRTLKGISDEDKDYLKTENYDFDFHEDVIKKLVHKCGLQLSYEDKIPLAGLSIYELGLPNEIADILYSNLGVANLISLLDVSEPQFLSIEGIDEAKLHVIKSTLKRFGYEIKEETLNEKIKGLNKSDESIIEILYRQKKALTYLTELGANEELNSIISAVDSELCKAEEIIKKYGLTN